MSESTSVGGSTTAAVVGVAEAGGAVAVVAVAAAATAGATTDGAGGRSFGTGSPLLGPAPPLNTLQACPRPRQGRPGP